MISELGLEQFVRNPSWTRDELILGLDLYVQLPTSQLDAENAQIRQLSELLNALPIHPSSERNAQFRNPIGVAMELRTFLSFDQSYPGKGLERASKLAQSIWSEFEVDRIRLHATAAAIQDGALELRSHGVETASVLLENDDVFVEGLILTRLHLVRERNSAVAAKKKDSVLRATGRLACEVCGFDFEAVYGELGQGVAECHHLKPLAELPGTRETRLSDLAIVCCNCHRILHRSGQCLSIAELTSRLCNASLLAAGKGKDDD